MRAYFLYLLFLLGKCSLNDYNEENFPHSCLCFQPGCSFIISFTGRHSLWLGRDCCFPSPSEIPPHLLECQTYLIHQACRLDCKVLIKNFVLGHGKRPRITKSSIILLPKLEDSPCVAATPRCEMPSLAVVRSAGQAIASAFQAEHLLSAAPLLALF